MLNLRKALLLYLNLQVENRTALKSGYLSAAAQPLSYTKMQLAYTANKTHMDSIYVHITR